jgi:hypothetical protein
LCIHDARNFDEYTQVLAGDKTDKMTFLGGEEGATPLSTIFKLYRGSVSFIGEETGELGENHFPAASQI